MKILKGGWCTTDANSKNNKQKKFIFVIFSQGHCLFESYNDQKEKTL